MTAEDSTNSSPGVESQEGLQTNSVPDELAEVETVEIPDVIGRHHGNLREVRLRETDAVGSLIIPIRINGVKTSAVVDTAAQVTVVSRKLWGQLKDPPEENENVVLKGAAEGSRMGAAVAPGVRLKVGGQEHKWTVHVAHITDSCILGLDFLKKKGCVVDLIEDTIQIGQEVVQCSTKRDPDGNEFQVRRVTVGRRVVVPPNTAKKVAVTMPEGKAKSYVLEPKLGKGLLTPYSLIRGTNNNVVVVQNNTSAHQVLKKGQSIGRAVEAETVLEEGGSPSEPSDAKVRVVQEATGGPQQSQPAAAAKSSSPRPTQPPVAENTGSPSTPQLHKAEESSPSKSEPANKNETPHNGKSPPVGRSETTSDPQASQPAPEEADPLWVPPHLTDLLERSMEHLTTEQAAKVAALLRKYADVFSKDEFDLGHFKTIKHRIDTGNAKPIRQRMRRTPLGFQTEEEAHLNKMLACGVIQPSASEWASPPVLVRKKDGGVRWCIDYRALNDDTLKDASPLPLIAEYLDTLGGTMFMSTLDLASGYWQIELEESSRSKTAFLTKHGLFEHTRMGFGLCNAPATFQRAMQLVLQGLTWKEVLAYLDDVIVVGRNFEDHLANLDAVFARFRLHNLKLKPKKCIIFQI